MLVLKTYQGKLGAGGDIHQASFKHSVLVNIPQQIRSTMSTSLCSRNLNPYIHENTHPPQGTLGTIIIFASIATYYI